MFVVSTILADKPVRHFGFTKREAAKAFCRKHDAKEPLVLMHLSKAGKRRFIAWGNEV